MWPDSGDWGFGYRDLLPQSSETASGLMQIPLSQANGTPRTPDYFRAGVAAACLSGTTPGLIGILAEPSPTMMKPAQ